MFKLLLLRIHPASMMAIAILQGYFHNKGNWTEALGNYVKRSEAVFNVNHAALVDDDAREYANLFVEAARKGI